MTDRGKYDRVMVSCTFSYDKPRAEELKKEYEWYLQQPVEIGGVAYMSPSREFIPGMFLKKGITITSRGCVKSCSFCLVSKLEGKIKELPIKEGNIVYDNNLLACSKPHIKKVFEMLRTQKAVRLMNLDAQFLEPWMVEEMKSLNIKDMWFSYDKVSSPLLKKANLLKDFPPKKKRCYVLIGSNGDTIGEAETRLKDVYRAGFYPFAMLYVDLKTKQRKTHSKDWNVLQRTWTRPAIFKSVMKEELH